MSLISRIRRGWQQLGRIWPIRLIGLISHKAYLAHWLISSLSPTNNQILTNNLKTKNTMTDDNHPFMPQRGNYRNLIVYQKAECIYDITYYFAHKFLEKGDRTIDQMVQAARSCKQNIAEGSAASTTSKETELKLTNVGRASLQELLADYEDYLRVRGLTTWELNSDKAVKTRAVCSKHNDSAYYREAVTLRSDETVANIAITLIHQTDALLRKFIERLKRDFVEGGGLREEMYRARTEWLKRNKGKR